MALEEHGVGDNGYDTPIQYLYWSRFEIWYLGLLVVDLYKAVLYGPERPLKHLSGLS